MPSDKQTDEQGRIRSQCLREQQEADEISLTLGCQTHDQLWPWRSGYE